MKILASPNMFQLRLGWLVPLVRLIATDVLERPELAARLFALAIDGSPDDERQDAWLAAASLGRAPQGRVSPRAAPEIVRMAAAYGVHDPEGRTLTDLGRVLWLVAGEESPFVWPPPKRLVGLRILLGADGDVALALLRAWPHDELRADDALAFVSGVLRRLADSSTSDAERAALEQQAARTRPRDAVHPRLEPLRELGLLASGSEAGGYRLTDAGRAFIANVGDRDASALIEQGLASANLAIDRQAVAGTASADEILKTLRTLPAAFQGASQEAPLEAVALLTQARLLSEGRLETIDLAEAQVLTTQLGARFAGRIELKAGASVESQNIAWRDTSVLTGDASPSVAVVAREAETKPSTATPVTPGVDASAAGGAPPSEAEVASPSAPQHDASRLWLIYLLRLLDRPTLGNVDCLVAGGPWSWSDALLRGLGRPGKVVMAARRTGGIELDALKDEPPWMSAPLAIGAFKRWHHDLADLRERLLPFSGALDRWERVPKGGGRSEGPDSDVPLRDLAALRVALTHSRDAAHKIADLLATNVGAFFATPGIEAKRWGVVRALTRSHIEDLLARGSHRRDELFSSVAQRVGASGDDTLRAATAVLADLTNTPEPAGYLVTQDFTVPSSVLAAVSALSEDEAFLSYETGQGSEAVFVTPGNDAGTIQVSVELRARTAVQAKLRGIHYAREALCKLSFAASLSFEPSLDGSHWKIVGSEPRVALADGTQAVFQELTEEVPDLAVRPAAVGFVRAYPQNLSALVSRLPTLARIEAWAPVEAGSRLARTLHWLTIADQLDAQAAEKLAHAWTAVEHLVVAGTEAKGADVIRYLASVGAVERLLAIGGDTYRECLAALHINACLRPTDQTVIDALCESLGAAERSRYQGWTAGVVSPRSNLQPAADLLEISDRAGLSQLLRWGDRRLLAIAKAIAPGAPYAGRRLEEFALDIAMDGGRPKGLLRLLRSLYFEAAALLQHVYDLRNQLVHDADPFVYEGAHRMDDLHQRFRILVDPLVGRLICRAAAGSTDLAHMLALEASTYARLNLDLERCISGPAPIPYQVDRLLSYLPDW